MKVIYLADDGKQFDSEEKAKEYEGKIKEEIEFYKKTGIWNMVTSKDRAWGYDGFEWMGYNRAAGHMGKSWKKETDPEINAFDRCREFMNKVGYLLNGNYPDYERKFEELGVDIEAVKSRRQEILKVWDEYCEYPYFP